MPQNKFVDHPVRRLRKVAGVTQVALADQTGLTEIFVRRAELGMMGTGTELSSLTTALSRMVTKRYVEEDRDSISQVTRKLALEYALKSIEYDTLPLNIDRRRTDINALIEDWHTLLLAKAKHDLSGFKLEGRYKNFDGFVDTFCKAIGSPTSNVYQMCRILGLHLFIVQRFAETPSSMLPLSMKRAFEEVGINWEQVDIGRGI